MENKPDNNRRSFFAAAATVVTGAITVVTPLAAGLVTFFSPLAKKSKRSKARVALLDQVPDDGQPRAFPIVAEREDAWNKYPAERVGSVYLVRETGEELPLAFTAKCPHAGCFIGYTPGDDMFRCPCHTSSFKLDGTRARGDAEVSPRDMDRLPVELVAVETADGGTTHEIWVEFIDFQTGHKEAVPTV